MSTLTRRVPELKEVERNSRLQAQRDLACPANSKIAKVNIVDSGAFWYRLRVDCVDTRRGDRCSFFGGAPTVVVAAGTSLIDHLPLVHGTRQPSARWTEPEDAREALFGPTER